VLPVQAFRASSLRPLRGMVARLDFPALHGGDQGKVGSIFRGFVHVRRSERHLGVFLGRELDGTQGLGRHRFTTREEVDM